MSRIIKAFKILAMNFGTIYIDFFEPIKLSKTIENMIEQEPTFDPFTKKSDRMKFN